MHLSTPSRPFTSDFSLRTLCVLSASLFASDLALRQICTPLAMEQLQSEHLMSWMLGLGKDRLEQLLGRLYDLKKRDIIQEMVSMLNPLHPQILHQDTCFLPSCPRMLQAAI